MKYLLLLAFLAHTPFVLAQKLGFKAGLNFNDCRLTDPAPYPGFEDFTKVNLGFNVGINYTIQFNKRLSLLPELQFIKKGFRVNDDPANNIYNGRVVLNYVELPLLFSVRFLKILNADIGPSIACKLSARGKSNSGSNDASHLYDNPIDWGLNSGLRVKLGNNFSIGSRYYLGFSTIAPELFFTEDGQSGQFYNHLKNHNLQIGLIYSLKEKN
jgi:hypothetical protein